MSDVPFLVGRDAELAQIESAIGGVAERGGTVRIAGNPGVGKSALLCAGREQARPAQERVRRPPGPGGRPPAGVVPGLAAGPFYGMTRAGTVSAMKRWSSGEIVRSCLARSLLRLGQGPATRVSFPENVSTSG